MIPGIHPDMGAKELEDEFLYAQMQSDRVQSDMSAELEDSLTYGQVQSNALAALEAIDKEVARKVFSEGCITGDRINGLCDGVSGKW